MEPIEQFEKKIGYGFRNKKLLKQALTHSSYANEMRLGRKGNNERLEFLGDAVLELVVSDFLFLNLPVDNEGKLSKLRASLVCEATLASCANELDMGDFIYLSKGEESNGGRKRKSILSDALEAVFGAMYLDGGIEPASKLIKKLILTNYEEKVMFVDSKTRLQEIVQGMKNATFSYKLVGESGPDHNKHFEVEVYVNGEVVGRGGGNSKKLAEQEAAYNGILKLKGK